MGDKFDFVELGILWGINCKKKAILARCVGLPRVRIVPTKNCILRAFDYAYGWSNIEAFGSKSLCS